MARVVDDKMKKLKESVVSTKAAYKKAEANLKQHKKDKLKEAKLLKASKKTAAKSKVKAKKTSKKKASAKRK